MEETVGQAALLLLSQLSCVLRDELARVKAPPGRVRGHPAEPLCRALLLRARRREGTKHV